MGCGTTKANVQPPETIAKPAEGNAPTDRGSKPAEKPKAAPAAKKPAATENESKKAKEEAKQESKKKKKSSKKKKKDKSEDVPAVKVEPPKDAAPPKEAPKKEDPHAKPESVAPPEAKPAKVVPDPAQVKPEEPAVHLEEPKSEETDSVVNPEPAQSEEPAPAQNSEDAPEQPPVVAEEEEVDEVWDDAAFTLDTDFEKELTAKRVDKAGNEIDRYDRVESRPEDNMSMFTFEAAGSGDQALAVKPWVGQITAPDEAPPFADTEPEINLELEYIYGYRCFDTRQNIFYRNANEIVYMAAAVGIVLNSETNTQRFFGAGSSKTANGHSDDITALAIHPDRKIIATGEVGKNPKIIIWNSDDMSVIKEWRQGRGSRAVTTLAFNFDGSLLASAALDNDHTVRVFNTASGEKVHEENGGPDKILDSSFSPTDNTLCTAGIKHIYFWMGEAGWEKKKGIFGGNDMCNMTTAGYLADGRAITGGVNGCLYLWENRKCVKSFSVHAGSIHTLRVVGDCILSGGSDHKLNEINAESLDITKTHDLESTPRAVDKIDDKIVVGCRNGNIVEIDGMVNKVLMESHSDGEVWGLAVSPDNPYLIVTSGDDNKIKLWDVNNRSCIRSGTLATEAGPERKAGYGASTLASTSPNQQARAVAINKANSNIAVAHNDGHINIRPNFDDLDNISHTLNDSEQWIESIRYSPDGSKLAIGSHDCHVYIYDANTYELLSKEQKHSSYLTALDWSVDGTALHSTCGAYELLYWKLEEGKIEQVPSGVSDYKNEEWETFSTHFGWPVQGIFGGVIDYTHVNRVDRSPDKQFFAVGNDWGLVEIFGSPNSENAKSRAFRGHSEHVTNVKWNCDGSYLFSAGGYDQCIMQWKKV